MGRLVKEYPQKEKRAPEYFWPGAGLLKRGEHSRILEKQLSCWFLREKKKRRLRQKRISNLRQKRGEGETSRGEKSSEE